MEDKKDLKSDDIDDILDTLDKVTEEDKATKEVVKKDDSPDIGEKEVFLKTMADMTLSDRKMADNFYKVFAPEVALGRDRSQASKEAMAKAIELKITAAKNILEAYKIAKEDAKSGNNVGIFFGETQSSKKVGIDISKIQQEISD